MLDKLFRINIAITTLFTLVFVALKFFVYIGWGVRSSEVGAIGETLTWYNIYDGYIISFKIVEIVFISIISLISLFLIRVYRNK